LTDIYKNRNSTLFDDGSRGGATSEMNHAEPQWFTDIEIVQLTVIVAAMTVWNRVEMSFSSPTC
jgi:alkylhydroperoxidase family enzyme